MKKIITVLFILNAAFVLLAQSDDPAIQKAKEETAVIFDLGRFFGYLHTMEQDAKELALTKNQMTEIYNTLTGLLKIERVEIADADETLLYLEEELLTLDQLIYVDELAMEKMNTRISGSGTGSGGGQLANYVAGGAFNPLTDQSKTIGKDVSGFMEYLKKKLGK
ncbi:MAG: hypothetical protein PF518_02260 [Spirochaetaceae bacterium]|jgi:hypothetical protein|nr:hypothetical protein [Spirochaetaceae bacterium]